ncbi:hypothetical protein NVP1031O_094 [Vibrio phage 1.031.O._10N.261.46.F8]|nr:hypothetical protein NVP1031O_094 [Vibrio phage 1.031.O._10N.261.46.F8]
MDNKLGTPKVGDIIEVTDDLVFGNGPWTKTITGINHYRNPFTDQYKFEDETYDIDWRMFTSMYAKGGVSTFVIGESSVLLRSLRHPSL